MPLQATSGAASYDAFGGGVPVEPVYIEQIFQTWLYTGNGTSQTITNGVDLSGKGGLVWIKARSAATDHYLHDSARSWGTGGELSTNNTAPAGNAGYFNVSSTGFSLPSSVFNDSGTTYASWTFREQAKFFDVVTYTGDGQTFRTVNHNLGSMPGFIICKCTSDSSDWSVLAKMSSGSSDFIPLNLNTTASSRYGGGLTAAVSSTLFYTADLGFDGASNDSLRYNQNGQTYVAYLFASNAGGFGPTGSDNVISCGSFTTDGSANATVNLGYEPQWVMWKSSTASDQWQISDTMRGWSNSSGGRVWLRANAADAETVGSNGFPTSTGFEARGLSASQTYIYIAIRRGPMKVPTTGTSVFSPNTAIGSAAITTNFPVDTSISSETGVSTGATWGSRLQGAKRYLSSYNTDAEGTFGGTGWGFDSNTRLNQALYGGSTPSVFWNFQRAPGYFDVVCYTGDGGSGTRTISHNLTVAPELLIIKTRSTLETQWIVGATPAGWTKFLTLQTTNAASTSDIFADTNPTSSVFSIRKGSGDVNESGRTFVAYLFATCPGVSKVGSYTGTATTQVINCGFTAGARFVMIKAVSTGSWYVWDSARGIVAGNDPYLLLNSTAAEVTTTDWVDTAATGFELSNAGGNLANSNGVTYIFLSIS